MLWVKDGYTGLSGVPRTLQPTTYAACVACIHTWFTSHVP